MNANLVFGAAHAPDERDQAEPDQGERRHRQPVLAVGRELVARRDEEVVSREGRDHRAQHPALDAAEPRCDDDRRHVDEVRDLVVDQRIEPQPHDRRGGDHPERQQVAPGAPRWSPEERVG